VLYVDAGLPRITIREYQQGNQKDQKTHRKLLYCNL
jgi:hypothetical protein